ncbi:MAG: hypothetical protein TREMPRED_004325, partial [Tremellales sp. Tagirdzhanova-0007]
VLLNASRVGAAEARDGLDRVDVDLRGVEYERDRVREEIERCEDYTSAFFPSGLEPMFIKAGISSSPAYKELDILDVESFREAVSEEVLSALPVEEDESFEFAQTIARLEHELSEIQQREALLAQLTKDRDALIKSKKEIKAKFDAVDVYLTDFAKTSNAVASKVKDVSGTVRS